ncbi:MotA/TolQ/ExbB proton channel family protein [Pelistega europaea]|uniref:Biopolymer transport protein ExbB n=2 Tax=Pelistega europaea TaxID=106147 RepID=A0A7Y4L9M4_9BURK|nr:MotA/TolQ/ExbB proton channel family protein [Pelistega europaea]NOL49505.1 MotA/TolQ/ExbB proton channel family protein [Pelistega europaea]
MQTAGSVAGAAADAAQAVSQAAGAVTDASNTATAMDAAGTLAQGMSNTPEQQSNFLHFVQQSDVVGKSLFGILVLMSILTWYIIIVKTLTNIRQGARTGKFLHRFWNASSLQQVYKDLHQYGVHDPFSRLANEALHANDHYQRYGSSKLSEAGTNGEFITRTIRKVIDEETARVENGLTILGSVGSTAPFVGLFGTVWGVYHALIGIGLSDGVSINKIAGPVGEALIMTGLGLAVAIPAVLAFNAFVRHNRVVLSQLDGFAYDLFAFLTTGQQVDSDKVATPSVEHKA